MHEFIINDIIQYNTLQYNTIQYNTIQYNTIFTFNKHFDKENYCVDDPLITKPHHWRRLLITFYIVNF